MRYFSLSPSKICKISLTTPYQTTAWLLYVVCVRQSLASHVCKKGKKNEGHAHLLLGYPLVCFKLPCLFGTSTETDVALPRWIIYCTSWCRMEGLPSYPAGLSAAMAGVCSTMTTASKGCSFIVQLSFLPMYSPGIWGKLTVSFFNVCLQTRISFHPPLLIIM